MPAVGVGVSLLLSALLHRSNPNPNPNLHPNPDPHPNPNPNLLELREEAAERGEGGPGEHEGPAGEVELREQRGGAPATAGVAPAAVHMVGRGRA